VWALPPGVGRHDHVGHDAHRAKADYIKHSACAEGRPQLRPRTSSGEPLSVDTRPNERIGVVGARERGDSPTALRSSRRGGPCVEAAGPYRAPEHGHNRIRPARNHIRNTQCLGHDDLRIRRSKTPESQTALPRPATAGRPHDDALRRLLYPARVWAE